MFSWPPRPTFRKLKSPRLALHRPSVEGAAASYGLKQRRELGDRSVGARRGGPLVKSSLVQTGVGDVRDRKKILHPSLPYRLIVMAHDSRCGESSARITWMATLGQNRAETLVYILIMPCTTDTTWDTQTNVLVGPIAGEDFGLRLGLQREGGVMEHRALILGEL